MDVLEVDPDLRAATKRVGRAPVKPVVVLKALRAVTRRMPVPKTPGVEVREVRGARLGGTRGPVQARVYLPVERRGRAALLWIHGGGMLFGDARQDEAMCAGTAADLGIVVVSANYRCAPEHPFPAPLDDVTAAWRWTLAHAEELGIDPERIAIGGGSAGGGIAASLVQRLHDQGGTQPVAQWLFSPMLDDRTAADRSLDGASHFVWHNAANRVGWSSYLSQAPGLPTALPYAVPARRTDLTGLPPAFVAAGDIELFFAEDGEYARRLGEAGVEVTWDVTPGAPHGFDNWAGDTAPARAFLRRARTWLGEVLAA
jgi:acetyl esterase/lipase